MGLHRLCLAHVLHSTTSVLVSLGRRAASENVVDLLAECHGRIRRFLAMAHALAGVTGAPPDQIASTAAQIRRYFAEGFPLHVEDEEVDIAPHLPAAVAATIKAEHASHESVVGDLVAACSALATHPERLPELQTALRSTMSSVSDLLEAHLVFEEAVAFPEIRRFDEPRQQAIRAAMRSRRERHLDAG